jgi:hypothetical protein
MRLCSCGAHIVGECRSILMSKFINTVVKWFGNKSVLPYHDYSYLTRLAKEQPLNLKLGAIISYLPTLDTIMRTTCRVLPSINTHEFMPIHFANNGWNEYQSLKARTLCKTPLPDMPTLKQYRKVLLRDLDLLLPGCKHIKSVTFEEYVSRSNARGPVLKVLTQVHEQLELKGVNEHTSLSEDQLVRWTKRSAFIKVENLLYLGNGGEKNKTPRTIQGAEPEFICLVGPWIMAVQDAVKRAWGYSGKNKNSKTVIFSSGMNGENIGEWASAHKEMRHMGENDVGKFDASCDRHLLQTEGMMFGKMGAPCATLQLIMKNVNTKGKTRWGIKYKCKGGRKSGDPYTSVGNSILNAMMHIIIYSFHFNIDTRQAMREMRMIVQGDDNVLFHERSHVPWKEWFAKFGFDAEPFYRDQVYDLNFCSARFLPVVDGIILSPNPGRVWMKFGVFAACTDAKSDLEEVASGAALGNLYNLHHVPGAKEYFAQYIKKGTTRDKVLPWEIWLSKFHNPMPGETSYWLDKYNNGLWCDDWSDEYARERIFESNTDAPTLWFSPRQFVKVPYCRFDVPLAMVPVQLHLEQAGEQRRIERPEQIDVRLAEREVIRNQLAEQFRRARRPGVNLSTLECPCCMEQRKKGFVCDNNHFVCFKCWREILSRRQLKHTCPICRNEHLTIRNQ